MGSWVVTRWLHPDSGPTGAATTGSPSWTAAARSASNPGASMPSSLVSSSFLTPAAYQKPPGPPTPAGLSACYRDGRLFRAALAGVGGRWENASVTSTVNAGSRWEEATVPRGNSPWTTYRLPDSRSTRIRPSRGSAIQYSG